MNDLPEILKTALTSSAYQLEMENKRRNPYYQQLQEEQSALFDSIQKALSKADRPQLMRLEELQNHLASIDGDYIYLQGMIDCAALLRAMRLF